jgi:hypothetical protein
LSALLAVLLCLCCCWCVKKRRILPRRRNKGPKSNVIPGGMSGIVRGKDGDYTAVGELEIDEQGFLRKKSASETRLAIPSTPGQPPVKPDQQVIQQSFVNILSVEPGATGKPRQVWKPVYLVLKRGGQLHCYMGVVCSNEGHKTYCGELWALYPGDIDDFQSQGGRQHRFLIQTASGDCLYFAAHTSKQLATWVAAFNSLPPPTVSKARPAGAGGAPAMLDDVVLANI